MSGLVTSSSSPDTFQRRQSRNWREKTIVGAKLLCYRASPPGSRYKTDAGDKETDPPNVEKARNFSAMVTTKIKERPYKRTDACDQHSPQYEFQGQAVTLKHPSSARRPTVPSGEMRSLTFWIRILFQNGLHRRPCNAA